jgi:hypothetical protein
MRIPQPLSPWLWSHALLGAQPGQAADPKSLLAGPHQAAEHADYRASGHLVHVDEAGKRTSDDISIKAHWFAGSLHILIEITAPADARQHVLLDMHPGGQSTIRIAHPGDKAAAVLPFEKWADGPLGPRLQLRRFSGAAVLLAKSGRGAVRTPRRPRLRCSQEHPGPADKSHYTQVRTWLDHTIDFPVYVEKTLKAAES